MSDSHRGGLPPKLYFRIGEVATLVGVEPHVLRYWEREFRSIRPSKSAKGQRVYSRRDVENLLRVRELLYAEGFTIAGAKKKLQRTGLEPHEAREARETQPTTAPQASGSVQLREQLVELRTEVAAFLEELGGSS
jgi:DNA-binding transcriptional MerR regulator